MINENFLSNESHNFFEKLLIKIILYELDWQLVLQNFLYLINNEDKHRDIQLISDLSQLIFLFFHINNIDQSFVYHSNETIKLNEFFQLLLSFLNQISEMTSNKKFYTPSLSSENDIDNINFLMQKIIRHMKMKLLEK
jgi:hypothetical protein